MDIKETLAINLRRLRQEREISQEELAHRAVIDRTYISSLERCVYAASIDMLAKIAAVLEVHPHELLMPTHGDETNPVGQ